MEIRRAYLRRSIKQARLQKRLCVAAMFAAASCAAWIHVHAPRPQLDPMSAIPGASVAPAAGLRLSARPAPAPAQAPRRVYPYSIVPGGVSSSAELARAVMADKIVAAHYAGVALDKAALRTVAKPRAVYVSYRKGDQVYWTAHKVMLAEGETVLSDGVNDIRTRCGNRISDTPRLPVEARGPAEQELDTPFEQFSEGKGELANTGFKPEALDIGGSVGLIAAASPHADAAGVPAGSTAWERMNLPSLPGLAYPQQAGFTRLAAQAPSPDTGTGDPQQLPPALLRPDGLPNDTPPAQAQAVPEPAGLWLTGLALAALLLQRRLRARRPRQAHRKV
jgi:hypothetical protein